LIVDTTLKAKFNEENCETLIFIALYQRIESVKRYKDFYRQRLLGANSKSLGVNIFGLIYKIPLPLPLLPPPQYQISSDTGKIQFPSPPPPPMGERGGRDPSNPI
jgi:hypothetical protein